MSPSSSLFYVLAKTYQLYEKQKNIFYTTIGLKKKGEGVSLLFSSIFQKKKKKKLLKKFGKKAG